MSHTLTTYLFHSRNFGTLLSPVMSGHKLSANCKKSNCLCEKSLIPIYQHTIVMAIPKLNSSTSSNCFITGVISGSSLISSKRRRRQIWENWCRRCRRRHHTKLNQQASGQRYDEPRHFCKKTDIASPVLVRRPLAAVCLGPKKLNVCSESECPCLPCGQSVYPARSARRTRRPPEPPQPFESERD
jgi:hypothetical protein